MRPFSVGFITVVTMVAVDMYLTGGLYTAKFLEMGGNIMQSFRHSA